jgi:hypothetical protein
LLKQTWPFRYQLVDSKHLWAYVKFDWGLSIPVARKVESKKNVTFTKDSGLSFFQMPGFENVNFWPSFFYFIKSCFFHNTR